MPVVSKLNRDLNAHQNPPLETGEVYRLVRGSDTISSAASTGGLFVYVQGTGAYIVYLKGALGCCGGYDDASRIQRDGFLFEVANIAEVP